jgi:hypothetical protein
MGRRKGTEGKGDAVCMVAVGKQLHCFRTRLNSGFLGRRGWSFWAARSSIPLEKLRPMTLAMRS